MEKMLIGIREKPKTGKWLVLSLQHVFAMFGATVLVPMLTGLSISVALFASGVGTLIYIICTKAKVPVYLGSSFAYISVIVAVSGFVAATGSTPAVPGNYGAVMTGLLGVGIVYVIIALVIKKAGTKWLNRLLPPVVIGPMIAIIGLSLAGSAVSNAGFISGGNWRLWLIALTSFITVVIVSLYAKGFWKIIPFLLGIVTGYIMAIILGQVDYSAFINVIKTPSQWFKIPNFMFLSYKDATTNVLGTEITFNKINLTALITIMPIAFVTACEHIGDHAVLSKITGQNFLEDPGLDWTLMGDGIATGVAALIGGPANTTYGENTAVVGMSKVASVYVTGLAAIMAIILSFCNIFVSLISTIPASVMGGITIILYGFIAGNGLKVLVDNKVDLSKTKNIIIVSAMMVLGIGGAVIGKGSFTLSGMSFAAIVGIILNLVLKEKGNKEEVEDISSIVKKD